MSLEHVRVVLVRPEEAGNVGAAARVLKNFGLHHLVLVSPRLDRPEAAYRWAHGAEEVVEGADIVDRLPEAVAPCRRAWATSRRRGRHRGRMTLPHQAAGEVWDLARSGQEVAWVFGPESRGLTTEEMGQCSDRVRIPASPRQPSLNLAQAVAICAYETFLAATPAAEAPSAGAEASLAERNALHEHLREALLAVDFLLPHSETSRMAALRSILDRAHPTPEEVRLLRGLARRVLWAGQEAEKAKQAEKAKRRSK
jgi:tRNA/rRNA methyltransferase